MKRCKNILVVSDQIQDDKAILRISTTRHVLAARGKSQAALRAARFRQLSVAKPRKTTSIPAILRLDLTKNCSLSLAADFHHGLLGLA